MPIILIRARTARNDSAAIETLRAACLRSAIRQRHRSANETPHVAPQRDLLATLRRRRVDASARDCAAMAGRKPPPDVAIGERALPDEPFSRLTTVAARDQVMTQASLESAPGGHCDVTAETESAEFGNHSVIRQLRCDCE
jgi:hypothetical protein